MGLKVEFEHSHLIDAAECTHVCMKCKPRIIWYSPLAFGTHTTALMCILCCVVFWVSAHAWSKCKASHPDNAPPAVHIQHMRMVYMYTQTRSHILCGCAWEGGVAMTFSGTLVFMWSSATHAKQMLSTSVEACKCVLGSGI